MSKMKAEKENRKKKPFRCLSPQQSVSLFTSQPPGASPANPISCLRSTGGKVIRQNLLNSTKLTGWSKACPSCQSFGVVSRQIVPFSFRITLYAIVVATGTSEHHELFSHVYTCHTTCRSGGTDPKPWCPGDAEESVRNERGILARCFIVARCLGASPVSFFLSKSLSERNHRCYVMQPNFSPGN